ncbi:MAG: redoxin domain-containing protein [Pseudomonadales bacterium]|nr:redoxin domain-containing protein [Pseudomonadales bacterium]
MVQLVSHQEELANIGIAVAGMTYDATKVLADFHAAENLNYPLLRDQDAQHVTALGIRSEEYEEGHRAYGIPHPGVIFLDGEGVIRAKYAVPGYRQRPPFDALVEHLRGLVASGS